MEGEKIIRRENTYRYYSEMSAQEGTSKGEILQGLSTKTQQQHNNKHETTKAAVIDNNSRSSSY